jgi:ABC-type sugar transport system permease subunit
LGSSRSPFFRGQYLYLLPAVAILVFVSAYPLAFNLYISFHHFLTISPETPFIGFGNYEFLFRNPDYLNSLRVSLIYTTATVALSFFLGLILALLLNEELRGQRVFRTIMILPLTIAPVVVGFAWRYLLNPELGLYGAVLLPTLGLNLKAILGDPTIALWAVILADVWGRTPLMFLILLAGLQAIPRDLYRAAKVDGANRLTVFRYVTLPMLRPAIVVALMLKIIDSINAFDAIYVMTGGGPGNATQVFSVFGVRLAFQFYNLGAASALGFTMVVISSIAASILIRYLVR